MLTLSPHEVEDVLYQGVSRSAYEESANNKIPVEFSSFLIRGTPEGDKVTGESLERDRSIGFLTLEIQSCAGTVGTGWGAMGGTVG